MLTKTRSAPQFFKTFNLPEQNLSKLSFCGNDVSKLEQWLESLPVSRVIQTSVIFYKALPELCQLKMPPGKRIHMLEATYPYAHRCIDGVMHELLRQPLLLPAQMMKLALIAQALQRHLNDGYTIALRDLLQTHKETNHQPLLALCMYRAISGLSRLLLRSYQFYTLEPLNIWHKLHALFQLAMEHQLENTPVKDSLLKNQRAMTIAGAYKRSLLLACSSPYQLRQVDMGHIFQAVEQCSPMLQLQAAKADDRQSLYCVSLTHDKGPFYSSRLDCEPGEGVYAIGLEPLIRILENTRESKDSHQGRIHFPIPYSNVLVTHLLRNWKKVNIRQVERRSNSDSLEICIGLTAVHNQLLGDNSFESLAYKSQKPGLSEAHILGDFNRDWQIEEKLATQKLQEATKSDEPLLVVKTTNASANGFCLIWDNTMPDKVRVGELLGLRRPKSSIWQIGIVCWAQRYKDNIYTGVRLLSPKATPYAVRTVLPDGSDSPYFRALLLEDLVLADSTQMKNDSIITPSIPFDVNQIITLRRYEKQMRMRLTDLLLTSTTVSQFTYRPLNPKSNTRE